MLVYGDRQIVTDPRAELARLDTEIGDLDGTTGVLRHGRLAGLLIAAGQLAQGLADAAFEERGFDDAGTVEAAAMDLVMTLARSLAASWDGMHLPGCPAPSDRLSAMPLPARVTLKTPEGYAFYAVYPEAYLEAARQIPDRPVQVIGLRSIGTSLAAMAAVGADAPAPVTLRPTGHPYSRVMQASGALRRRLASANATHLVVDEGPGLSGSSFGAAGDLLTAVGAGPERIILMPSHPGEPGPRASPDHLARWRAVRRPCETFDSLALRSRRLEGWFEDLLGRANAPLKDLSGGAWRGLRPDLPATPTWAQQERRKFLMQTDSGDWLLKFVGLGRIGEAKLQRAQRLAEAGFIPPPAGWRHGFIAEPWLEAKAPGLGDGDLAPRVGAYLAFRAGAFAAPDESGASLAELVSMADYNLRQHLGDAAAPVIRHMRQLASRAATPRRIRTDGRLHRWEWLATPGGELLKADALDHDDAHDLIGCQDVTWDIAGAAVELGFTEDETDRVSRQVARTGVSVDPALLGAMHIAYCAFQIGYWTLALGSCSGEDEAAIQMALSRYRRALSAG